MFQFFRIAAIGAALSLPVAAQALTVNDTFNGVSLTATFGNAGHTPDAVQLLPTSTNLPGGLADGSVGPFTGSVNNQRRSPWLADTFSIGADTSDFAASGAYIAAIPKPNAQSGATTSVTEMTYGGLPGGISFLWGSVDLYNSLSFISGGVEVATYGGTDLWSLFNASGAGIGAATNGNYRFNAHVIFRGDFDALTFKTTQNAFEIANVAPVPLPAAAWLLMAALGGLAALRRRQTVAA